MAGCRIISDMDRSVRSVRTVAELRHTPRIVLYTDHGLSQPDFPLPIGGSVSASGICHQVTPQHGTLASSLQLTAERIPQKDISAMESPLLHQLQVEPHTTWKIPFSAADDHGGDTHLELVD